MSTCMQAGARAGTRTVGCFKQAKLDIVQRYQVGERARRVAVHLCVIPAGAHATSAKQAAGLRQHLKVRLVHRERGEGSGVAAHLDEGGPVARSTSGRSVSTSSGSTSKATWPPWAEEGRALCADGRGARVCLAPRPSTYASCPLVADSCRSLRGGPVATGLFVARKMPRTKRRKGARSYFVSALLTGSFIRCIAWEQVSHPTPWPFRTE